VRSPVTPPPKFPSMWTPGECRGPASTEIAVDIWCSSSAASRTSLSAIFPVSTQTMPRQAGSPRSAMAAAFFGPGIPHHARGGADLLDDDAAAPPAIFNGASPRRIEVDPVGLCRDGDERRGLRLAPRRAGLVDVGGAGEPGDRDGADIGDREVGVQRLLKGDRMRRAVLHGEAQ
jgi:hypothetical protein